MEYQQKLLRQVIQNEQTLTDNLYEARTAQTLKCNDSATVMQDASMIIEQNCKIQNNQQIVDQVSTITQNNLAAIEAITQKQQILSDLQQLRQETQAQIEQYTQLRHKNKQIQKQKTDLTQELTDLTNQIAQKKEDTQLLIQSTQEQFGKK